MDKEKQIIKECKTLLEQTEPFQRKMKAKHSRMKKRVIGHGGQSNTPPYSEKPSMERSKSAPPIGEIRSIVRDELIAYLIQEGFLDKLGKRGKTAGQALALSGMLSGAIGGASEISDIASQQKQQQALMQAQQEKQNEINNKFYNYRETFNIFPEDIKNVEQFKQNFINVYNLKNNPNRDMLFKQFMNEIEYGTYGASAAMAKLADISAVFKYKNTELDNSQILLLAYQDLLDGGSEATKIAKQEGIQAAVSKLTQK